MDKKLAKEIAEKAVEHLFLDGDKRPVDRLMLVYGDQNFNNPGWGRESIRDAIADKIMEVVRLEANISACVHGFAEGKCVHETCINHPSGLPR